MPPAKSFWEPAPLTSLLSHIKDSVEYLQVGQTYIAALHRRLSLIRAYRASVISIYKTFYMTIVLLV